MKLRALTLLSAFGLCACGSGDEDEEATPPGPVCTYFSALLPRNNERLDPADTHCAPPPGEVSADGAVPAEGGEELPAELDVPPPGELIVTLGCDRRLGVEIAQAGDKAGWTFRQPEACSAGAQCGYWIVELDPDPASPPPRTSCDAYSKPDGVDAEGNPIADFSLLPDPAVYACGESATQSAVLPLARIAALEGPHLLRATLMTANHLPFPGNGDPNLPPSVRGGPIELPVVFELETCSEPAPEPE